MTRTNGSETVSVRGGDSITVNNQTGRIAINSPGARIDVWNKDKEQWQRVPQLPGSYG